MKIIYTYVVADVQHTGHLLYLQNAKALGDKLIVGVLTDKAVMEKKKKPILSFQERLRMIQAMRCVDCAVAQDNYSPLHNVQVIQPDILIESESHIGNKYLKDIEGSFKGQIIFMPYYPEQSSTEIKQKIKKKIK